VTDHDVIGKLTEMLTTQHSRSFSLAAEHQPNDLDVLPLSSRSGTARNRRAITPWRLRRHGGRGEGACERDPSEFEVRIGLNGGAQERYRVG